MYSITVKFGKFAKFGVMSFSIGNEGFNYRPSLSDIPDGTVGLDYHGIYSGNLSKLFVSKWAPTFRALACSSVYFNRASVAFGSDCKSDELHAFSADGQINGKVDNLYGFYSGDFAGSSGTCQVAYGGYFRSPAIGTKRCALYADDLAIGSTMLVDNSGNLMAAKIQSSGVTADTFAGGRLDVTNAAIKNAAIESVVCSSLAAGSASIAGLVFSSDLTGSKISSSSLNILDRLVVTSDSAKLVGNLSLDSLACSGAGVFASVAAGSGRFDDLAGGNITGNSLRVPGVECSAISCTGMAKLYDVNCHSILLDGKLMNADVFNTGDLFSRSADITGVLGVGGPVQFRSYGAGLLVSDSGGRISSGDSENLAVRFASATLTSPLLPSSGGTGLASWNPGDLFASGTRLPIGAEGYVLTSQGGQVVWRSCPGNVLSVSGTAGHVNVNSNVGDVILSLPQAIGPDADVTFKTVRVVNGFDVGGLAKFGGDVSATGSISGANFASLGDLNCVGQGKFGGPVTAGSFSCTGSINGDSINAVNASLVALASATASVIELQVSRSAVVNNHTSSRSSLASCYGLLIDEGKFDCLEVVNNYGLFVKRPSFGTNRLALFAENAQIFDGLKIGGQIEVDPAIYNGLLAVDQAGHLTSGTSQIAAQLRSLLLGEALSVESGGTGQKSWASGDLVVGLNNKLTGLPLGMIGHVLTATDSGPRWLPDSMTRVPLVGGLSVNVTVGADKTVIDTCQPLSVVGVPQFARLGLGVGAHDRYLLDVAGVARFGCSYADRMSVGAYSGTDPINSGFFVVSGAIGVGTNSPQFNLDVVGTSHLAGSVGIGCAPNATYILSVTGPAGFYGGVNITGRLNAGVVETTGRILSEGGLIANTKALATNATDGYLYSTATQDTPIGTPTVQPGVVPMVYDLKNDVQYVFNDGWKNIGGAIVAYANHTRCAVNNTLSRLCVKQSCIIRGAQWFNGGKTMAGYFDTLAIQMPGDYSLTIGGQIMSAGNGTTHVKVTRAGAVIYDQTYVSSISSDGAFKNEHILLDMKVGDVVLMEACEKNTASPLSNITDATPYGGGQLVLKLI